MKFTLARAFGAILVAGLAVASCGKDDDSNNDAPRNNSGDATGDGTGSGSGGQTPAEDTTIIPEGKFFLTAGNIEGFDANGNKVDPQQLQITGDYFWIVKHVEGQKYEITASGSAKISNTNQVLVEINCRGAQDVYVFDWTESGALRNLKQTETGCPQGMKGDTAQQNSIERLGSNSFSYTVVNQNGGVRLIETYTFKK